MASLPGSVKTSLQQDERSCFHRLPWNFRHAFVTSFPHSSCNQWPAKKALIEASCWRKSALHRANHGGQFPEFPCRMFWLRELVALRNLALTRGHAATIWDLGLSTEFPGLGCIWQVILRGSCGFACTWKLVSMKLINPQRSSAMEYI